MQQADRGQAALDGRGLRVALVRARFNDAITAALAQGCTERLQ